MPSCCPSCGSIVFHYPDVRASVPRAYIWYVQNPGAPLAGSASLDGKMADLEAALRSGGGPPREPTEEAPEELARRFHETYERLAPSFGYETRSESAVPWDAVPEKNRRLMVAVCAELLRGASRGAQ
jgi:hypothetical protein